MDGLSYHIYVDKIDDGESAKVLILSYLKFLKSLKFIQIEPDKYKFFIRSFEDIINFIFHELYNTGENNFSIIDLNYGFYNNTFFQEFAKKGLTIDELHSAAQEFFKN